MDRKMRRNDRELTKQEAFEVLNAGEYGVLSLYGDDGFPYGVPVSFVVYNENIYIHCSSDSGYKKECLKVNPKVSFTAVASTHLLPEQFATNYASAIVSGVCEVISGDLEKKQALDAIAHKYSPDFHQEGQKYIKINWSKTDILKISIKEITGKSRKG